MSNLRTFLDGLDADQWSDAKHEFKRQENKRAHVKSPSEMTPAEHSAWEADLIRRTNHRLDQHGGDQ